MSSHQLFIVDTCIDSTTAVTRAQEMYTAWVRQGIIEPIFTQEDLPGAYQPCFKVSEDCAWLHEIAYSQSVDDKGMWQKNQAVYGISINVMSHYWVEHNDVMFLKPIADQSCDDVRQHADGLFHNLEGGFYGCCPACDEFLDISDDERGEVFGEVIVEWFDKNTADLSCDLCGAISPLNEWHSDTFAVGCLAVTLQGVEVLDATDAQIEQLLHHLCLGDSGLAWVSCHG